MKTSDRWNRAELGNVDHSDCLYRSDSAGESDTYPLF